MAHHKALDLATDRLDVAAFDMGGSSKHIVVDRDDLQALLIAFERLQSFAKRPHE